MARRVGRPFPAVSVLRAVFGRHAAAPSSLGKRTRLWAATARVNLEWALGAGQVQAADLTGGRTCCSSNCTGLRYPRAECRRF